jgi:hypothetical protein
MELARRQERVELFTTISKFGPAEMTKAVLGPGTYADFLADASGTSSTPAHSLPVITRKDIQKYAPASTGIPRRRTLTSRLS